MSKQVKSCWENIASEFQEDVNFDIEVNWTTFEPSDLNVFSNVQGKDVIELGCGGGQCSVAMAKRGGEVVSIDISRKQLKFARELSAKYDVDIDFIQADITDLSGITSESFDIAFNTYVFHWVNNLKQCFEHTYRILRKGGLFAFSMPHPLYTVFDGETQQPTRSYFDVGPCEWGNGRKDQQMITYHHKISDIHSSLSSAGFDIQSIREPGSVHTNEYQQAPRGDRNPPPLAGIVPLTLIIESQKPE